MSNILSKNVARSMELRIGGEIELIVIMITSPVVRRGTNDHTVQILYPSSSSSPSSCHMFQISYIPRGGDPIVKSNNIIQIKKIKF